MRLQPYHHQNEYRLNAPSSAGVLRSPHFPGLDLAFEALLDGNWGKVLDVLQTSLQTRAHAAFVAQLAARKYTTSRKGILSP